jgi:hypothetical protein
MTSIAASSKNPATYRVADPENRVIAILPDMTSPG